MRRKKAVLCYSGFHACENPLDCLSYYSPDKSVYHEVDLDGVSDERQPDSKICSKRITIGARLDFAGMVKGAISFVFEKVKATTGYMAHAEVKGKNSIAAALGCASAAKAALGCWIVCAEYDDTGKIKEVKAAKVGGEFIKTDTWYRLKDGNFVEVK